MFIMQAFACIFFNMYAVDPHLPCFFSNSDLQIPIPANWSCVLGDLVALGKVGIEIILAGKIIVLNNFTMGCQAKSHCLGDGFPVQPWQSTRVSKRNGTDLCIGFLSKI